MSKKLTRVKTFPLPDPAELRTGNIILVHNPFHWNDFMSYIYEATRFVSGSYYHHAGIVFRDNGKVYIVEALGAGVLKTEFSEWLYRAERKIKIVKWECDPHKIIPYLHLRYDYFSYVFVLGLYILTGGLIYLGRGEDKAGKRVYCIELIALIYREKFSDIWYKITPKPFIKILEANGVYVQKPIISPGI